MKTATATVVAILVGALGALAAETYVDHRGLPASAVHHSKGVRLNCNSGLTRVCFYVHPPVSVACGVPDQASNWHTPSSGCSGNIGPYSPEFGSYGNTKPFYGQGGDHSSIFPDTKGDVTNVGDFGVEFPGQGYSQYVEDRPINTGGYSYPVNDYPNKDYVSQPIGNTKDIVYTPPIWTGTNTPATGFIDNVVDNIPRFSGSVSVPDVGQTIQDVQYSSPISEANYIPNYSGETTGKWPSTIYNDIKWPNTGKDDSFHILPYYGDVKSPEWTQTVVNNDYPTGEVSTQITNVPGGSYTGQIPTGSVINTVASDSVPSTNVQQYAVDIPEYRYPSTDVQQYAVDIPEYRYPSINVQQYGVDIPEYRYPSSNVQQYAVDIPEYRYPSTNVQQYAVDIPEYRYPSSNVQQYGVDIPEYRYPWSPLTYSTYNRYGTIGSPFQYPEDDFYYSGYPGYSSYYDGQPSSYRYQYPRSYWRRYQWPYRWNRYDNYGDYDSYYPISSDWGYNYDYPWWNRYALSPYRYNGYSNWYPSYRYTSRPYSWNPYNWKYNDNSYNTYGEKYVNDVSDNGNPLKIALYND